MINAVPLACRAFVEKEANRPCVSKFRKRSPLFVIDLLPQQSANGLLFAIF
jgi:hypothetical protein